MGSSAASAGPRPAREDRGVEHLLRTRAGDHDRGARGRTGVLGGGHGADAVLGGEGGAAAGGGVHADVLRAALAERRERHSRVRARADQQHAGGAPVRDPAVGELEGEPHERPAGAAQRGVVLDLALRLARALEQPLELGRRGAVRAGRGQRAAHLAGDLALAGDHGLEPGGDREQVLHDAGAGVHGGGRVQGVGGDAAARGDGGQDPGHIGVAGGTVHIDVRLEAVARREHDCAAGSRRQGSGQVFRGAAESLEEVEGGGLVIRRDAEQHAGSLRAPGFADPGRRRTRT